MDVLQDRLSSIEQLAVDKLYGYQLAKSTDTLLLLNNVPYVGVLSFKEPAISINQNILYSNLSKRPQATVEGNVTLSDGSITMLEGTLIRMRVAGEGLNVANWGKERWAKRSPVGYSIGHPIKIVKFIYGSFVSDETFNPLLIWESLSGWSPSGSLNVPTPNSFTDLRQVKVYENVIPVSESYPVLEHTLNMFTVDVSLSFTEVPKIYSLSF